MGFLTAEEMQACGKERGKEEGEGAGMFWEGECRLDLPFEGF